MIRRCVRGVLILILAAAASAAPGCSRPDLTTETVARVNGDAIKVMELREFLGVRGGGTAVAGVPAARKKEALDRLIAGRLLAQDARASGLDNSGRFRDAVRRNGRRTLITALFRKTAASEISVSAKAVRAEAKRIQATDNALSDDAAARRAQRSLTEAKARTVQKELIAAASKKFPFTIHEELLKLLAAGGPVGDNAVLATSAGDNVTYGFVKVELERMVGPGHRGERVLRNVSVIRGMLKREVTETALAAYAKQQGLEGSDWLRDARAEVERSILLELMVSKIVKAEPPVSDQEVAAAYEKHAKTFVRHGKPVPLAAVREQIRRVLRREKGKAAVNARIDELRKKATITVNEKVLGEV